MNNTPVAALFSAVTFFAAPSYAEEMIEEAKTFPLSAEATIVNDIPTAEKAFIDAINKFDKKSIVEQLGEPAKAEDVRIKGTDRIVASIWQYHNINTAEDGSYYPTTELDFIEDKVVQVVFLNNDGNEIEGAGQTYEIQPEIDNNELGDGVPLFDPSQFNP